MSDLPNIINNSINNSLFSDAKLTLSFTPNYRCLLLQK